MVEIDDRDELLRRVFHYHVKPDGSIASSAFMTRSRKPDPECSVSLAKITTADALLRAGPGGLRVVALRAEVPRSMGLEVVFDPVPDDPGHCLIKGLSSKEQCARLAAASRPIEAGEELRAGGRPR